LCLYPISNDAGSKHRILQWSRPFHPGLPMTTHLQFSKDGTLLFGIRNGDLQQWNLETGEHSLISSPNGAATTVAFNRDGTYLARYYKGRIGVDSMERQTMSHICKKVTDQKWSFTFSQDGCMLVAGGVDGQLLFWNNYQP
jgi:WD40 repeat protein